MKAGAQWFVSGVLFLTRPLRKWLCRSCRKVSSARREVSPVVTRNTYAPEDYRKKIAERVARLRQKYGFNVRPWDEMKRPVLPVAQLSLDLSGG